VSARGKKALAYRSWGKKDRHLEDYILGYGFLIAGKDWGKEKKRGGVQIRVITAEG